MRKEPIVMISDWRVAYLFLMETLVICMEFPKLAFMVAMSGGYEYHLYPQFPQTPPTAVSRSSQWWLMVHATLANVMVFVVIQRIRHAITYATRMPRGEEAKMIDRLYTIHFGLFALFWAMIANPMKVGTLGNLPHEYAQVINMGALILATFFFSYYQRTSNVRWLLGHLIVLTLPTMSNVVMLFKSLWTGHLEGPLATLVAVACWTAYCAEGWKKLFVRKAVSM